MPQSENRENASPYLLLVDDDEGLCAYLRIALKLGTQVDIVVAGTGEAGLAAAERQRPRLVILDLMLPDMDGFEFLRRFRGMAENAKVPVIGFSIHAWERDLRESLIRAGCDACLDKGREQESLVPLVKSYLED